MRAFVFTHTLFYFLLSY